MGEMNVWRNDAALENIDGLDKSRKTSCGLQMAYLLLRYQCRSDSVNTFMDLTFDLTEPTMRSSPSSRAEHNVLDMPSSSRGSPALVPVPYDSC